MRILLGLTPSKPIPFNYQQYLVGAIHKWLGKENALHGKSAMFSFSWLQNVEVLTNGIRTKDGSSFFISAYDNEVLKRIIRGIQLDPSVCFGANVSEITLIDVPEFGSMARLNYGSPILIKRKTGERTHHFEFSDPKSAEFLTETLQFKLSLVGLPVTDVSVRFDDRFSNARTKIVEYDKIKHRVNLCPVIIEGSPEQIAFAWHVGVGSSTGIGFGALK